MIIYVTQKDIDKARKELKNKKAWRTKCCPIAQALKRQRIEFRAVCSEEIRRDTNSDIKLSKRTSRFIVSFDSGKEVKPFKFRI